MTTIAYKDGIIAADSQATWEDGSGQIELCNKLFLIRSGSHAGEIVATSGSTSPGMVFIDWYENPKKQKPRIQFEDDDFVCLVLNWAGLYVADTYCRLVKVKEPFYATASGAPFALGAMAAGASAKQAVQIACKYSAYSCPPVVTMKLGPKPKGWRAPEGQH
jgi:ATP-dependent protease HslVU (ClpYQ) peptidase subunit